jgi:spermidine synthase
MELWYTEKHTPSSGLTMKVSQTLYKQKSEYQDLTILQTEDFGKVMLLDGLIMLTEKDEFVYHEMISHIAMYTHPHPKKVLIIGGGDGGTLREVTKHKSVECATLVEIDEMVINASKQYFPKLAAGFSADNAKVLTEDGIRFVHTTKERFDVIIIDSTDPIGPAEGLFHKDFYRSCMEILTDEGILVAQSESPFIPIYAQVISNVQRDLGALFPITKLYLAAIPTYPSGLWSFSIASKKHDPENEFDIEQIDEANLELSYYNAEIHRACFALPNFVGKMLV